MCAEYPQITLSRVSRAWQVVTVFADIIFEGKNFGKLLEMWFVHAILLFTLLKSLNILVKSGLLYDHLRESILASRWVIFRDAVERSIVEEWKEGEVFIFEAWALFVNSILFLLLPIIGENSNNRLMWDCYSPCDRQVPKCFWIGFIHKVYSYATTSSIDAAYDGLVLIERLCAYVRIFQHRLKLLPELVQSAKSELDYLKQCITVHQNISFNREVSDSKNWIETLGIMDIFDNSYFRFNKMMLVALGLWPFNTQILQSCLQLFWTLVLVGVAAPIMNAIVVHMPDVDRIMEDTYNLLYAIQLFLKYLSLCYVQKEMKSLYTVIANNWLLIVDEEEKKILNEYSKRGRYLSVFYTSMLAITWIFNMSIPLVPEILNVVYPLEVPRPHLYLLKSEFSVNKDDHFYAIYFWDCFTIFCVVIIFGGVDSMYMVTVEQGTALYAIITHRLSKIRDPFIIDLQGEKLNSYDWLIHTIKLHQTVYSYVTEIRDSYSVTFFCLSLINLVHLPLNCVVLMVYSHDRVLTIRYTFILGCLLIHIFALFWPGQKLIDHSTRLLHDAYCSDWYEAPKKTKILLQFFMLRCSKPFVMTAGGLMEMNFEVFLKILKTAASYVTVLASYR